MGVALAAVSLDEEKQLDMKPAGQPEQAGYGE